jgi:poly(3-hydroxybutyrate) depolymerase
MKSVLAVGLFAASLAAGDLPRGQVLEHVTVQGDASQSYALYVPASYDRAHRWPVLYCLDPGARGRIPVERFSKAAEKAGFIVVGSNNSQNGPAEPAKEAVRWMLADTHARLSIDDSRLYAAGFSGGARMALAWASNGLVAGVIACGAGFGGGRVPQDIAFKFFATAGVDDFNYDELYRTSLELARRGTPHRFVEFEGGHEWLPPDLASEALEFFQGRVGVRAAQPSKEQERLAARFEMLAAQARSADGRATIERLRKEAAMASDSPERRIARRVMEVTYISQIETSRELLRNSQYGEAAQLCENAVIVQPENGGAWFALAVAQAAAGNKSRALEALETAAARGFNNALRLEGEPLLDSVRGDSRFKAVLRKLGENR